MKKIFLCLALSAMILLPTVPASAKAKVSINKTSIALAKTKTYNLKLKNNKQKIKWTSSNKKIATVSKKGTVKGISNGSTKITAKAGKKNIPAMYILERRFLKINILNYIIQESVINILHLLLQTKYLTN